MRAVYRNPKELATAVKDLVDEFQDDLLTEDKFQERLQKIADANEERFIKNGKVEKIGESREILAEDIKEKKCCKIK